jgi:hypothetical protein
MPIAPERIVEMVPVVPIENEVRREVGVLLGVVPSQQDSGMRDFSAAGPGSRSSLAIFAILSRMISQPHPAVLAVTQAAKAVLAHQGDAASGAFWRRWFDKPRERHLADDVRAFVMALDHLLDVPPQMLTSADLVLVGAEADAVIKRVEAAIEDPEMARANAAAALVPAVYVIRARYEELYKRRGATKHEGSSG